MIFTRSRAYFNRTRVPSTKHIILRVCGWYLYFRLVFPGSDRIIILGIKDFERKCTLHRQNYVYICMGPTGPGHSLYISMSKCVLTSIHQNEGEKKLNGRFINCLKIYRYAPSVRMSGKIFALRGKHYENMARKEL